MMFLATAVINAMENFLMRIVTMISGFSRRLDYLSGLSALSL